MISPLAFVDPNAKIGDNVKIHPFAFVDKDVEIGDGCEVMPHASIMEGARLGKNVKVYNGAIVSAAPQDFRWKGERSFCVVGDNTVIREMSIINRSIHEGGATRIGSDSFVLAESHIGHDSVLCDKCVLGNNVQVAGDVRIESFTILSTGVKVFEGSHIGQWVFVKGGCRISGNVPPFVIIAHNPASYYGVNATVMRHKNYVSEAIVDDIAKAYRHIYQCNISIFNAVKRINADVAPSEQRDMILDFIKESGNKIIALPKLDIY